MSIVGRIIRERSIDKIVGVSVRDSEGISLSNAIGILTPDTYNSIIGVNVNGRITFMVPSSIPYPNWGYTLDVSNEGFKNFQMRLNLAEKSDHSFDVTMEKLGPIIIELPNLVIRNKFFQLDNGYYFTAVGCSDFNLYNRFISGEDIEPVLQQRKDCGFNFLRVWTRYDLNHAKIGRLMLEDHPDLYDHYFSFTQLCAKYGFYVEFTAYTSVRSMDHWPRLIVALQSCKNRIIELVNENDQVANVIDTSAFSKPDGIISSHGSNGGGAFPVIPRWDYNEFHTNLQFEWWRKVGHNAMEVSDELGGPTLANENQRFPDNDNSKARAYDAAAGAALLCAGSFYHSVHGKDSTLWMGIEEECAIMWAAGAASVPLEFQGGQYKRHDELLTSSLLRVYGRRLSDGREHIVKIRR